MTNDPFFSVVIPTYNRSSFIRKTIESVLAQSFQDFEIIVVDDGSTDNTEAVMKSITSDKIKYYKKENAERAAARNYGARLAKGKFLNFFDSDDSLYPHHLITAYNFIQKNNPEVFHLGFEIKNDNGALLLKINSIHKINTKILNGNNLSCNGVFIKNEIVVENPFNEDRVLSSLEDWELWIRLAARYIFMNSNQITSVIIQHDDRSVMTTNREKIKSKIAHFINYVNQDPINNKTYGKRLNRAFASANTYAALHLAIAQEENKVVFQYLLKGIFNHYNEVFKKRFLVIIKLMLFNIFK